MDDEVLVGVLDRRADPPEQGQAAPRVEPLLVAISGDRPSVDMLHHQVGLALRGRASVEDGRNARVLQAGQDLALLAESPLGVLRGGAAAHQLHGDRLLERVVVTHRAIDGAHPAVGDHVQHTVGTDACAGDAGRPRLRESGPEGRGLREEWSRFVVRGQQRLDLAPELGVGHAGFVEERSPRVGRTDQRVMEQVLDAQPARGCQRGLSFGGESTRG